MATRMKLNKLLRNEATAEEEGISISTRQCC